jgi:NADP-dependent 3-hydroxy acid dehydrogenase YdfG
MFLSTMRILWLYVVNRSGLVKGMEQVGDVSEDDIRIMMDTNVTGLINVRRVRLLTDGR